MTDETEQCGHPTAGGDGPPCSNPATEGDHCWLEAHGGDVQNGREFAIDESDHDDILEAARMGASKAGCARAAGVDKASLLRYLEAHGDFRTAFMRARHEGEHRLLTGPLFETKNSQEEQRVMDGQHARFILSTSFDYNKKQELEDVTEGSEGFGTTIVLDSEYVDDE